ncbi:hypothetical protein PLICRDRAFT_45133 [Plicaturopsis crispa FD-325 SS-3]|uniref:MYND-type domain-containing protein n=1 Tax=Plicaturopsis crispa FD-325 SS-3 TaxID=944288 RepID=A0A0C9SYF6_PLICR|nr:hypothetical protein PLICRDRAFT_45133 [Plicaturopsis crispa FD-325 SS-3]
MATGTQDSALPRRFTKDDLPEGLKKLYSPEHIAGLCDADGYLVPPYDKLALNPELKSCFVCGTRTAKKCSRCKSVNYCSANCQRSHWSDHKHLCGMLKEGKAWDPTATHAEMVANPHGSIARYMTTELDMRSRGRAIPDLRTLLHTWLGPDACPHGGNIWTSNMKARRCFTVSRCDHNRVMVLNEMAHKAGKTPKAKDRVEIPPEEAMDAERYIARIVTEHLRKDTATSIFADLWLIAPEDMADPTDNRYKSRRGAQIDGVGKDLKVIQFEPNLLRESDKLGDGGRMIGTQYLW